MKRLFMCTIAAAIAIVAAGGPARAANNPTCATTDTYCVDTNSAAQGNDALAALVKVLPPGVFAIGAVYPTPLKVDDFYVFWDGNPGDPDPFDGYIGVSGADVEKALLGLVYNSNGNFDRLGGNTPVIRIGSFGISVPNTITSAPLNLPAMGIPAGAAPDLQFPILIRP